MKPRPLAVCLCLGLSALVSVPALAGALPVVPVHKLRVREGLPNFFAKVASATPVKVAYFGGSITAHKGWRVQTFEWLQQQYPDTPMTMIPASVGGTGSIVGAFRADADLVAHHPDLAFIEFAVNDGGDARQRPADVKRAMEGIVRKVRTDKPDADICLVYTLQESDVGRLAGRPVPGLRRIAMRRWPNTTGCPPLGWGSRW